MIMNIQFYYNQSDERTINKQLISGISIEGVLRNESSVINPSILLELSAPISYNYCYIPVWQRYYFVKNVTSVRNNLYMVDLQVDVLMSFRNDISNYKIVINKQTEIANSDEYIDDNSLVANSIHFTRIINFTRGFNDSPEYILITAG